jgi:hypothetical protein
MIILSGFCEANGMLRAVENIQLFLDGRARDLMVPRPGR